MNVNMIDGLSAVRIAVDIQPVAVIGDALAFGTLGGDLDQVSEQRSVRLVQFIGAGYMRPWNDQAMYRRLRGNVPESEYFVIFIDQLRRYVAVGNLAK